MVARISGDSTVAYSFAFARAVEEALEVEPPPRAKVLRGVMAELERVANHFGDIGAICNDASFSLIHAHCGIFRERVLAAADRAFGHRLMMDRIVPGGVEDTAPGGARGILLMIEEIEPPFAEIVRLYDDTPSLQDRTCTTGIVGHELVDAMGRRRPCRPRLRPRLRHPARSSPMRRTTARASRCRCSPRATSMRASGCASARSSRASGCSRPGSPTCRPGRPASRCRRSRARCEGIAMTEAFRGDVLVWVRIADGRIARCHARDASWFQWPLLEAAIENNIVADFPLCNKSFNCSYSGHDL